jgi:hypothetical protein
MTTNSNPTSADQRRDPRVTIPEHPEIRDAHSGKIIGQLVNLSSNGLMVAGAQAIPGNTVCQLRVPLTRGDHHLELRIGAVSLWCEDANDSGMHWTGFQIIDISPADQHILDGVIRDQA